VKLHEKAAEGKSGESVEAGDTKRIRKKKEGRRETGGRKEGGWREAGGRLEGGWREAGGRLEEGWREAGGRLEGGWREAGGSWRRKVESKVVCGKVDKRKNEE
jgi:hypothetical protein